ncbi:MAG: DUF1844 domain-containing protein [Candidatus Aminicenantes bacterium]|jgi:hypothetical protein
MTENKKKTKKEADKKKEKTDTPQEILPPLDFSSLFLPFYTQALMKLGATEDPASQKADENLELAKRLIDLLDLLKEKTKGNLKSEEETLLENGLHQLKMLYMEKAKIINL